MLGHLVSTGHNAGSDFGPRVAPPRAKQRHKTVARAFGWLTGRGQQFLALARAAIAAPTRQAPALQPLRIADLKRHPV